MNVPLRSPPIFTVAETVKRYKSGAVVVEPSEVCQKPVARSRFWPPPRYRRNPQVRNDGDAWPSGVAATAIVSMSSCALGTPQDSEEASTTRERDEVDGIVRPDVPSEAEPEVDDARVEVDAGVGRLSDEAHV